ncbi:histone methylation protein, putative [Phytophthora infestans T30-4]|uniref:Histone-lysine N-methyltransferase, H3 lysine-79 specific n=1 Tax=Phytophthora infestans (strain T30-4) TaxID=403677 RepID=D0N7B8_PHYIT|nr:histone methylation protein, putative [Phytophthora infestans T30-4]EEY53467.1 histone methylation protein, putative [Phytophthora infestans T30-4]|eukprot:XP_002905085.1 histone methylation protein, putative [Phytophthora infestans T30-4]
MRTSFTDAQDKRIVALALEYESQHKRVEWKEVARAMRSKHSVQAFENRLRALKRTYGRDLSRFPPSESAIRDIFSNVSAADVRQQAGKTDENAGEMLPAAISSVIQMIGAVHRDDVFLKIGAGLGNVAAQFAIQTIARRCLGIEKGPEVFLRGVHCLREHTPRLLLLHKVFLSQGDVLDTPLSSRLPFQRASIVFLNDFLFDELAKLAVQEQLYMMPRVHLIVSTSRFCPRHRDSCRRRFCSKWRLAKITYGRGSWKSPPIPIYMYTTVQ